MDFQIESAVQALRAYFARKAGEVVEIDRPEIVAHATLSAYTQHWPNEASPAWLELLEKTMEIKLAERSRWIKQRRLALAKLARSARERHAMEPRPETA